MYRRRAGLAIVGVVLSIPGALRAEHRVYVSLEARAEGTRPLPDATLRFGVPLTMASQVRSVSELVLTGATSYRLAPGVRRPDGTLEWVFVGAFASLPGGGLSAQLVLTTGAGPQDAAATEAELPPATEGVHVSPQPQPQPQADSLAADPLLRSVALLRGAGALAGDVIAVVEALRSGRHPTSATLDSLRRAARPVPLAVAARLSSSAGDLDAAFRAVAQVHGHTLELRAGDALELKAALVLLEDRVRTDEEADLADDAAERVALALGTPIELPPGLRWQRLSLTRTPEGVSFVVPRGLRRLRVKHAPSPIVPEGPASPPSSEIAFWAAANVYGERTAAPAGSGAVLKLSIPEAHHVAGRYLEDVALLRPVVTFRPRSRGPSALEMALALGLALSLAAGLLSVWIMRKKK